MICPSRWAVHDGRYNSIPAPRANSQDGTIVSLPHSYWPFECQIPRDYPTVGIAREKPAVAVSEM